MHAFSIRSLLLTTLCTTAAAAQDLPAPDDLAQRVQDGLPGYWTVESFRLIASESLGDPISPATALRFEVDAAPVSDLFSSAGESVGPFDVVVATHPADTLRTLYGTMQLDYRAGAWSGVTRIENPVSGLGQPKDLFTAPVIELGSEAQQDLIARLGESTLATAQAGIDAELRALAAAHAERVDTLRAERAAELRDIEAGHATAIAERETQHRRDLAALEQRLAAEIEGTEDRLADEVARHRDELAARRRIVDETHAAELRAMEERHAAATGELRARQAEEMALLETGFEAIRDRLTRQIETADEVISAQEAVLARQDTIDANRTRVTEILARNTEDRNLALEQMVGIWRGTADCPGDRAYAVALHVNDATSNSLSVEIGDTLNRIDRPTAGELILTPDRTAAPMTLRFATSDDRYILLKNGDEIFLGSDGQLGHPGGEDDCAFALLRE